MKKTLKARILILLYDHKKQGLTLNEMISKAEVGKKELKKLKNLLENLIQEGVLRLSKGKYAYKVPKSIFKGEIVKAAKTHGFVKDEETGEERFIRGRQLQGCVPGDKVIARIISYKDPFNRSDTAEVEALIKPSTSVMTGIVQRVGNMLMVLPSSFIAPPLKVIRADGMDVRDGDKVRFTIHHRGEHHYEHTVDIVGVYGNSDSARTCVQAYLEEHGIPKVFSQEVLDAAKEVSKQSIQKEISRRVDLRDWPIFTIDGADTKDIDDAISIQKADYGYQLGVHIADVSYYVKKGSVLDIEAMERGTSIYIADTVIPMLPKELSNGICSLNPQEDRLAFSCLMKVAYSGELLDFSFVKSVIRSRVQGVYSEINEIIGKTASEDILKKYAEVLEYIPLMHGLAITLEKNRVNRGSPEIDTAESKIICDENGVCIGIKARDRGVSENIIEEFMLLANNAAAKLAMREEFPFVYRIHEPPTPEKFELLREVLTVLGVDALGINENSDALSLSKVLLNAKQSDKYDIINKLVLRTMMKAKYSPQPLGHFGLVMREYAHFTSPIRRYADLAIHRILTDYTAGMRKDKLIKKYEKYAYQSSMRASDTELVALSAERDCEKFYMAEYMKNHIGECYDGILSGVTGAGIFVMLENTVEGRVDVSLLPSGVYEMENGVALVEQVTRKAYTVGDKVRVRCIGVSVPMGTVDFELVT